MRDGTRLKTDVYLPAKTGRYPVVLARSPYNRALGAGLAPEFVKRGYAFVIQNTRGRFGSEGENIAFDFDGWMGGKEDGYDTVAWILKQPWCNGKIGTWGASALGMTQILLAGSAPPVLDCMYVVVGAPYSDVVYNGGAFREALIVDWLRASQFSPNNLKLLAGHYEKDAFWRERDMETRWSKANAPAVHLGGWFDIFTQGTIDDFVGMQNRGGPKARGHQYLVMGPWVHATNRANVGDLTFPANAQSVPQNVGDQWVWYDHWLKGEKNAAEKWPAVTYYVMGDVNDPRAPGNEWRTASAWPIPSQPTSYYFTDRKTITTEKPGSGAPLSYTYDPKNPVPTVGGNNLGLPPGPFDQKKVESRPDVLVFTSEPLTRPVEVTGRVRAKLWISSDAPDTDFTVKLCDVYPDGRSFNICDGILRARYRNSLSHAEALKPGEIYPIDVDLWSTSIVFNKGHRIRAQVSSSDSRAYDVNPNTGQPFREGGPTRIAHNSVYADRLHPSRLLLPVVPAK
jgi:putative CocE/NonD family hydrolase